MGLAGMGPEWIPKNALGELASKGLMNKTYKGKLTVQFFFRWIVFLFN